MSSEGRGRFLLGGLLVALDDVLLLLLVLETALRMPSLGK